MSFSPTRTGSTLPPAAPEGSLHGYHLFVIRVRDGAERASRRLRRAPRRRDRRPGALHPDLPASLLPRRARLPAGRVAGDGRVLRRRIVAADASPAWPRRTSSGWWRSCARRCRESRAAPRGVGAAARASKARHPGLHADALARTRRSGFKASRRRTCRAASGAHVWDVDGNRYLDFPMALGPSSSATATRGQRGDRAPAAGRDRLHAAAPDRGRGRRAGRRARPRAPSASASRRPAPTPRRARSGSRAPAPAGTACSCAATTAGTTGTSGRRRARSAFREASGDLIGHRSRSTTSSSLDAALDRAGRRHGGVILEPVGADEPADGFLRGRRRPARAAGALVVFDEIITGFRLAPGGAQERYGVAPTWRRSARRSGTACRSRRWSAGPS